MGGPDHHLPKRQQRHTCGHLTGINSSSQAAKEGRFILAEDGDAIYAAEFFESGWNCGLDEAGVRDSFRLILSNWAGD